MYVYLSVYIYMIMYHYIHIYIYNIIYLSVYVSVSVCNGTSILVHYWENICVICSFILY